MIKQNLRNFSKNLQPNNEVYCNALVIRKMVSKIIKKNKGYKMSQYLNIK